MMKQTTTKLTGILMLALMLLMSACDDNGSGPDPEPPVDPPAEIPQKYQDLPGTLITSDTTWSEDVTLAGPHFVLPGATLTIEPGVTVSFEYHEGVASNVGTIITLPADDESFENGPRPSARLMAEGTADNPIVFTSARENPEINDWGGIILAGDAPINVPGGVGNIEGLSSAVEYGGDNADDDSGVLSYVRIEYSGFSLSEGSELQGLTLYAIGSGTNISHVNIFRGSDDGIEIFGGTVNVKYLVVYGVSDDSFDYDQGWKGNGQFWLAVQTPGADNGFENDGCDGECNDFGPTSPTIFNATVYGAGESSEGNYGLRLRENLQGSYNNIAAANFVGAPFWLEGAEGTDAAADPTYENYGEALTLSSIIAFNNGDFETAPSGTSDADRYQDSYQQADPQFVDPASFNFALQAGSPALSGGETPPDNGFFDQVSYIGAFGDEDWTQEGSWVRWPQ